MSVRLRAYDFRMSRAPALVGLCATDFQQVFQLLNSAQQRLMLDEASGDEGWWGSWAEMVFSASRNQPYITCPREVARIDLMTICDTPRKTHNQFYEYLQFGNGRLPKSCPWAQLGKPAGYTRNNAVTFTDLANAPQGLRVFSSDPSDAANGLRVLLQGHDQNGATVYSTDPNNSQQITGEYVTPAAPFADSAYQWQDITGVQKDVTAGAITIWQVDPSTGVTSLLLTMEPGEQTASYRRYYLDSLPASCCNSCSPVSTALRVTAIVKLDLIPVAADSDYCLIQNLEALIEEAQAIRLESIDATGAKSASVLHHRRAVQLLQGEIRHYLGFTQPALKLKVFGSDRLKHVR